MALILFGVLALMLILNVPIAISLGVAVLTALFTGDGNTSLVVIVQRMFTSVDNFPLMAVPFFILSGDLMERGGISKRLTRFAKVLLGKLPASLSIITTIASAFFGAISGSNPATVAAIGGVMIPSMEKAGYPKDRAAAIAASAGTLGVVIPPSISMVTYAIIGGVSIGTMFIAGFIPGLLLAMAIILVSVFTVKNFEIKDEERITLSKIIKAFLDAIWALFMPVIILGGIYGGIFTPTEASAVAVVYSFLVAMFVYKEITWKDLPEIFSKSAVSTAVVLLVVTLSAPFSWLMTSAGIPTKIAGTILGAFESRIIILFLINAILLFLGCFLETQSIILLMTPMLLPLATSLGMDPVALGIIMVINTSIGMITPPMAVNLFVASGIAKVSIGDISKRIWPFFIAEIAVLLLLTYFNDIILFLPGLLG
ncbi:TRAP transporter large permease [Tissierella sp. Yu-01]|uniref:TRAP transporter large permease n=1 Tax=Tissierella sp. Yu-01 TaxID=3035694 RepID=UPI00240DAA4A|nr:TRAP transporter large permease [Tissierella sp. Yu-01]WFA08654.1 TRAP transporter large permease [Tissierella sp. Yu-01]